MVIFHSYVSHYQRICLSDFMPPSICFCTMEATRKSDLKQVQAPNLGQSDRRALWSVRFVCVSCAFLIGLIGCTTQLGLYYWLYPPMKNGRGILWEHMEFCSWENHRRCLTNGEPLTNWEDTQDADFWYFLGDFSPQKQIASVDHGTHDPSQMIHLKGLWAQLSPSYPTNCSMECHKITIKQTICSSYYPLVN